MPKKCPVTPIVMVIAVVLCAAARVFAISKTDMMYGSLNHGYEIVCNVLFYGVIVTASVIGTVFGSYPKKGEEKAALSNMSGKPAVAVGFGMLVAAVCIAYDAVFSAKSPYASVVFMIISYAFAAMFAVVGFVTLYKKSFAPALGFAYSFGGVFYVVKGIFFFRSHMVVAAIPEYVIEGMTCVLGGLFFVMAGRLLSGNVERFTGKMLNVWGMFSAVLTLSAFIGTVVAKPVLDDEISQRIVFTSAEAEQYFQAAHGTGGYWLAFPSLAAVGLGVMAAITVISMNVSCGAKKAECCAETVDNADGAGLDDESVGTFGTDEVTEDDFMKSAEEPQNED